MVLDERVRQSSLRRLRVCLFSIGYQARDSGSLSVITGRWPEKSVRFILRLLKNAESNADAKNLELEDLFIKNIVVQQAPVRPFSCFILLPFDSNPSMSSLRKPAAVHTVLMVVLTRTRVTRHMWRYFCRRLTLRLRRAKIRMLLPLSRLQV